MHVQNGDSLEVAIARVFVHAHFIPKLADEMLNQFEFFDDT